MRIRTFFTALFCCWTFFGGSTLVPSRCAFAQVVDAKATAKNKAREGQRLAGKGEHEKALALFKEAYEANPEPGYLYNIGIEQQALGHDVEAFAAFERFLRDVQQIPPEFVADANQRLRELRKRIGELGLRCNQEGARVSVDDVSVGQTPIANPVRVAAGSHRVAVQKDGFEPFQTTVQISGGGKQEVDASLHALGASEPNKPAASRATAPIANTPSSGHPAGGGESKPPDRHEEGAGPFHVSLSAGASFWLSGARETPQPSVAIDLGAGYRVVGSATGAELRLGARGSVSFVSEPASTDVLVSALFNPMLVVHANRLFFWGEVGVGVLVLSGVTQGSVLLRAEAANVSGALAALELRPGLGGGFALGESVAIYLEPTLAWSPSPSPLFEASFILRAEIAAGFMFSF